MKRFHFVGAFVWVISTVRTSKCLFVVLLNAKDGKDTILFRIARFYFVAYFWAIVVPDVVAYTGTDIYCYYFASLIFSLSFSLL